MKELIKTLRAVKYSHDNVHLLAADAIEQLLANLAALKTQEPVAHVEIGHMVGVRFHEACDYGCGLKDGDMLYLAAGAQPKEKP